MFTYPRIKRLSEYFVQSSGKLLCFTRLCSKQNGTLYSFGKSFRHQSCPCRHSPKGTNIDKCKTEALKTLISSYHLSDFFVCMFENPRLNIVVIDFTILSKTVDCHIAKMQLFLFFKKKTSTIAGL